MAIVISTLREQPLLFDTVAHRIWDFSWKAAGRPLRQVADGLRTIVSNESFPFALVAHEGPRYAGSVLGIVSDMDERPQLTPWVAALWVEPQDRGHAIGRMLLTAATQALLDQGFPRVHLCARAELNEFYVGQGFMPIEYGVGPKVLTIFAKP